MDGIKVEMAMLVTENVACKPQIVYSGRMKKPKCYYENRCDVNA